MAGLLLQGADALSKAEREAFNVAVATAVEAALASAKCGLRGESESHEWPSPVALWRDEECAPQGWYDGAKGYWDDATAAPATVDGVLGGFSELDEPDIVASRIFLSDLARRRGRTWDGAVALDVAAGIGRVTKHLLLPAGFGRVDVLEQAKGLYRAAPDFVAAEAVVAAQAVGGEEAVARCRFICAAMQTWRPAAQTYDLIWCQWCVGHFTDGDFVAALRRYRDSRRPGGLVVVKDNVLRTHERCADGAREQQLDAFIDVVDDAAAAFYVDDADRSVCRSKSYYLAIFKLAGATVLHEETQPTYDVDQPRPDLPPLSDKAHTSESIDRARFPSNIYPVVTWALTFDDGDAA